MDLIRALLHSAAVSTVKENHPPSAVLRVRIVFGPGMMLGPGRADRWH
jgi:hypothetical protein